MSNKKIIIALDNNDNITQILDLITELKNESFAFKIGYEFFF